MAVMWLNMPTSFAQLNPVTVPFPACLVSACLPIRANILIVLLICSPISSLDRDIVYPVRCSALNIADL